MTGQADLPDVLCRKKAANNVAIAAASDCDKSYHSEYKRYVFWVQNEPDLATTVPPFITCVNVDQYFTRVIASRTGNLSGMCWVVNALSWYTRYKEYVGADPPFCVSSPDVETVLQAQQVFNKDAGGTGKPGTDPHGTLKDILPESDKVCMMDYIYRSRPTGVKQVQTSHGV
jgi:hypothetical protein